MTRQIDRTPGAVTLIIVPSRWHHEPAINTSTVLFLTWEELEAYPPKISGMRFSQIAAMSPPVGQRQSQVWADLSPFVLPGGRQFYM